MQLNFLVAGADKVVNDVRRGSVAASATEPLVTGQALDNTGSVMDAAISG